MQVSAIMSTNLVSVTTETSLDDALRLMDESEIRHLPVVEDGQLLGILSSRDLLEATGWLPSRVHACRGPEASSQVPTLVREVMTKNVAQVDVDGSALEALAQMLHRSIGCLPVSRGDSVVGMVSEIDVLKAYYSGELGVCAEGPDSSLAGEHMTRDPRTILWSTSLGEAAELCSSRSVRHLPVLEASRLVGIISDRDLRRALGVGRRADMPISDEMTRNPICVSSQTPLKECARILLARKIGSLPVVDEGEFAGILTLVDVLMHVLNTCEQEAS